MAEWDLSHDKSREVQCGYINIALLVSVIGDAGPKEQDLETTAPQP